MKGHYRTSVPKSAVYRPPPPQSQMGHRGGGTRAAAAATTPANSLLNFIGFRALDALLSLQPHFAGDEPKHGG